MECQDPKRLITITSLCRRKLLEKEIFAEEFTKAEIISSLVNLRNEDLKKKKKKKKANSKLLLRRNCRLT